MARIQEITGGPGAHYAFEAIGLTGEPFRQSIECTRKRGVTVFVGHAPHGTPVDFDARMLMPEKMVIGSMYGSCRPRIDVPRLLSAVPRGQAQARRAGHAHLSARAGQRGVRGARRGPGRAGRAPHVVAAEGP